MSHILNKETLQTGSVIYQKSGKTTVDTDVIVPDINPDVKKVLDVDGYVTLSEKSIKGSKVYIRGTVFMTVLYAPDGEVMSKVKSISASKEFDYTADTGLSDPDGVLSVELDAESFNHSLINSRKINLRCVIDAGFKITAFSELEFASSSEESTNLCTMTKSYMLCSTALNAEDRISVTTQYEIPSDCPSIGELLKTTVIPESTEFILDENKAVAKGQLKICNLYTSLDDGSVRHTEQVLPFSETLSAEGAEEDMEGEIDYSLCDVGCEIREDSDGEPRIIGIDVSLGVQIRGHKIYNIPIICDAYLLDGDANVSADTHDLEVLVDNTTAQLTHKETLAIPEGMPEISGVCNASSTASVEKITVENGEISLQGKLNFNILYKSEDEDYPLCSFSKTSDFVHTLPSPEKNLPLIFDAKVFAEHTSYTMNSGDSIELRVVLGLCIRSFAEKTVTAVTDISPAENDESGKRTPSIVIYFVRPGDTLWGIAKKYRTTVEKLKEFNGLTSDDLDIGQQIKICK